MGGREIVEGKHHVAVLAQTLAGLGIFVLVAAQEAVVGRQGILSGGRQVHLVQQTLGIRAHPLGQLVEDIGRLMHPTLLGAGARQRLLQSLPET